MSPDEASLVLGVTPDRVREMQLEGLLPDPIPDDLLDVLIPFRIRVENAARLKVDRMRGTDADQN